MESEPALNWEYEVILFAQFIVCETEGPKVRREQLSEL